MALPLPAKICATYFTLWSGGARITSVPTAYNQIYLFHCTPSGGGAFTFEYGGNVNAADIKACQARGQRVVLTCGGANAGFNFQSRTQSQAFVDSFKKINTSLGGTLDGIDFNNFEAQIGSNPTEMTWIAQQLKAAYGANFSVSAPPAPGAGWAPQDRVLCKAMMSAGVMDYAGPQFYDSSDLTQAGTITSLMEDWIQNVAGGDASKMVIGLSSNYGAGPSLATCQSVWKTLSTKYPKLRGVFAWSAQDDAGGSYNWGKAMGPLVGAAPVTGGTPAPAPAPTPAPSPSPTPAPSPAPTPAPAPSGAVTYVPGTRYPLNTVVLYNGKYYQVYQVDTTGTSNGTDPVISTWYWKAVAAPAPSPAPTPAPAPTPVGAIIVGDHVKIGTSAQTGTVTAIAGQTATIKLDNVVTAALSKLTKV